MPIMEARKKLAERQKASDKERVEVYKNILKRVHPVMRHFFTEKHHVPYWWFQMRLNYSRSAAAMSMVGYVMGLGDRHVSNIMIDTVTGELVPIDFGIAFEAVSMSVSPAACIR
jgi:ataxia telangiectasia mutated family protein